MTFGANEIINAAITWHKLMKLEYPTNTGCMNLKFRELIEVDKWVDKYNGNDVHTWTLTERGSKIIQILNSPHAYALFKAYEIANEQMNDLEESLL